MLASCLALAALALAAPFAEAKVSIGFENRVLVIQGGKGKNKAGVRCGADGNVRVNGKGIKGNPIACSQVVEIDASMGGGADKVDFSGVGGEFGKAKFPGFGNGTGVASLLGDGNDRYIPSATAFNLAFGEAGRDRCAGGRVRDILSGGSADDVLNGGGGRDSMLGNGGSDRVSGGAGADILSGNADGDLLIGAAGRRHPRRRHGQRPPPRRRRARSALRRRRQGPPQRRRRQGRRGSEPEEVAQPGRRRPGQGEAKGALPRWR